MSAARLPDVWPHRGASELVSAGGVSWHVQRFGAGPALLLVHGTGASTHSLRELASLLCGEFEIVMADLPGHGFSGEMETPGLPNVAGALGALMRRIGVKPEIAAGHSAGAAVALRMALDGAIRPAAVVGLCPALQPYGGAADGLASKLVRVALLNPLTPRLFAMRADERRVVRLIAKTGSNLDEEGVALYTRLLKRPAHIAGTLRLMAHWRLRPLSEDLPRLTAHSVMVAGARDRATPPGQVEAAARRIPNCETIRLEGLGHLAHEEDPAAAAAVIRAAARGAGLVSTDRQDARRLAGGGA
ncbi:MAG: alpha/beta fold hydrolase BchO [Oceanicaulis sp.]